MHTAYRVLFSMPSCQWMDITAARQRTAASYIGIAGALAAGSTRWQPAQHAGPASACAGRHCALSSTAMQRTAASYIGIAGAPAAGSTRWQPAQQTGPKPN